MVLAKWGPWRGMLGGQHDVHETLRRFFGDWWTPASAGFGADSSVFSPAVEAFARDGDLVVRAELPGIDPEKDVDITLEDNVLTIRGERKRERREEGERYFRSEALYGSFERRLLLPESVSAEDITASYRDGILEVVVPKAAAAQEPKRIPIRTGEAAPTLAAEGHKE